MYNIYLFLTGEGRGWSYNLRLKNKFFFAYVVYDGNVSNIYMWLFAVNIIYKVLNSISYNAKVEFPTACLAQGQYRTSLFSQVL